VFLTTDAKKLRISFLPRQVLFFACCLRQSLNYSYNNTLKKYVKNEGADIAAMQF